MKILKNLIKLLTNPLSSTKIVDEDTIPQEFKSHDYERKLALIVKSTDTVNLQDLKYIVITKLNTTDKSDLFSAYRLDFDTRDQLKKFKKKYNSLLI